MKNEVRGGVLLVVLFVAYTMLTFALPFVKNGVLWLSYLFGVAAIAAQIYVMRCAFVRGEGAKSKFYGFPIAKIGVVYLAAQLVLGLVFMALAAVAPLWSPLVVYVLLLGAACVGFIAADAMRDEVEKRDAKLKIDVSSMRTLQSKARSLAAQNLENSFVKELETLSDAFRYSDPVSSDATKELEAELFAHLDMLANAAMEDDAHGVVSLCKKTHALLDERNRICKLNK